MPLTLLMSGLALGVVFFASNRYRAPFIPAFCVLAGGLGADGVRGEQAHGQRKNQWWSVAVVGAVVALMSVLFSQLTDSVGRRADHWYNLGNEAYAAGDGANAESLFQQSIATHPRPDALFNLGQLHASQERWAEAARWMNEVVQLNPSDEEARKLLAQYLRRSAD